MGHHSQESGAEQARSQSSVSDFGCLFGAEMYEDWLMNFSQQPPTCGKDETLSFNACDIYGSSPDAALKRNASLSSADATGKSADEQKVELPDGRCYIQRGNEREYYGPNPGDQFTLRTNSDGTITVLDENKNEIKELTDACSVEARNSMMKAAQANISDPFELARFRADTARFEARTQQDKISPEQTAATYNQVERVLNASGDKPLTQRQRNMLAEQVIMQAASPHSIDQGNYNTCNVTTVEVRTYSRNPEVAAKLIADVATTGSYIAGGAHVKLNKASLTPQGEAAKWPQADEGDRTYATQLFNVTAVNLYYARYDRKHRYEQAAPTMKDGKEKSNGENLIDRRTGKIVKHEPDLSDEQIAQVHNMILGKSESGMYLGHATYMNDKDQRITAFTSELQFKKLLEDAQQYGRFPVILKVDTTNEPWYSQGGAEGDEVSGAHVVTIVGYEAGPPAKVLVDNQWGDGNDLIDSDTSVSLRELYLSSMSAPDAARQLRREVRAQQDANGYPDLSTELEMLRLCRSAKFTGEEVYGNEVLTAIKNAETRWATDPEKYKQEKEESIDRVMSIAGSLRPEERANLLVELSRGGLLTEKQFDEMLGDAVILTVARKYELQASKHFGPKNSREHQAAVSKLANVVDQLPEERQFELFGDLKDKPLQKILNEMPPAVRARLVAMLKNRGRQIETKTD